MFGEVDKILDKYRPMEKKGIVSYSSKFFAASTIATLATLSYCITDGIIYGFKFNRHLSMLILFSAAFAATSLMLVISYGVFKYSNKRSDSLKEAVKISNRKVVLISGKVFAAALAISVTSLACTLITSAINGQDINFLSSVRETFGFSSNGAWIGGSCGLLLCFIASSFVVFAISGLMHLYSKDKDVSWDSRYYSPSLAAHQENAARRDSNPPVSSLLSQAEEVKNEGSKKKF
ncbi:MAG: hypothetical protein sL5_01070 [Candidatus Mesenet longicola]|uniref:Uncharacterized protein n=1 Tax=Candidatus Mesenet longicola TaxID=1892558 RepID=A0A8J3HU74_9RICK|nr:MAG: hypothetical protein sL5_01070 [Candidatus Mesenet longicola]